MAETILAVRDLHVAYGSHQILRGVDFDVAEGEVVAMLGPNGAGKTTILNTICGFVKASAGRITLGGPDNDIIGQPPHRVFRQGVVQVSQARDLFPDLTVEDNLRLGAVVRGDDDGLEADLERVWTSFPRLAERRTQNARSLSGGEQQMAAIGRAVMGRPRILLLDEPSGGLAPLFVNEIGLIVESLKKAGTTMLLVEQNIALAFKIADRLLILRDGQVTDAGAVAALQGTNDEIVQRIYL